MTHRKEKLCSTCRRTKTVSEFHASNRRAGCVIKKGTYIQSRCKSCQGKDKAKYRKRNKEFLGRIKLSRGCLECGYNKCAAALDFHHTKVKNFSLSSSRASQASFSDLEREIKNCIILCANCHRERHAVNRP